MIDLRQFRENPDIFFTNAQNKNEIIDTSIIVQLDEKRRTIINEVEKLKEYRNTTSKEIASLKAKKIDAESQILQMKEVSDKIKELDDNLRNIEDKINTLLLQIPNLLHHSVPKGKSSEDNLIIKQ